MRMRKISEKVPTLDDLIQKFLLAQGSGAYHLSAPLHCNTAKLPLTLVSGSSFLLGNLQRHKLQPHVQFRTVDDYAVRFVGVDAHIAPRARTNLPENSV